MSECRVFKTQEKLANFLTTQLLLLASQAIENKKKFYVGLSGGSVAKIFCEHLSTVNKDQASFWQAWHFVFCDERYVSHDDAESTYGFYKRHFFDKLPIPSQNVIKLNHSLPIEQAAATYEEDMKKWMRVGEGSDFSTAFPSMDVLLLGMGPDGHTCSLFPQHPILQEKEKWVTYLTDSPKPPPSRITLTLPFINSASCIFVVACGSSKATVVKDVFENKDSTFPIAMVRPIKGRMVWLADEGATKGVRPQHITHSEL